MCFGVSLFLSLPILSGSVDVSPICELPLEAAGGRPVQSRDHGRAGERFAFPFSISAIDLSLSVVATATGIRFLSLDMHAFPVPFCMRRHTYPHSSCIISQAFVGRHQPFCRSLSNWTTFGVKWNFKLSAVPLDIYYVYSKNPHVHKPIIHNWGRLFFMVDWNSLWCE